MRFTRSVAALATSTVMATAAMLAAPTTASANDGDAVTSFEVAAALGNTETTDGNLVSEPAPSTTDANSAAVVIQNGTTTDVPKNPEDGVAFATDGAPPITIGLPNADDSKDAKRLSDGTVVYPGTDGSANAVIPTEHGVQMLTTIENADAPTRFTYKVNVPDGGKVEITEDGSAPPYTHNEIKGGYPNETITHTRTTHIYNRICDRCRNAQLSLSVRRKHPRNARSLTIYGASNGDWVLLLRQQKTVKEIASLSVQYR